MKWGRYTAQPALQTLGRSKLKLSKVSRLCSLKARPPSFPDSIWGNVLIFQLKGISCFFFLPLPYPMSTTKKLYNNSTPTSLLYRNLSHPRPQKRIHNPHSKGLSLTSTILNSRRRNEIEESVLVIPALIHGHKSECNIIF